LDRTLNQRELLLYAQRAYLHDRFPDYDPSRRDLWDQHNRPWDFDHLHASAYFYNAKSGDLMRFGGEWGRTIGNLRAWPFEENRSDGKTPADEKIKDEDLAPSLLLTKDERDAFSRGDCTRHNPAHARVLAEAVKSRFIRIYQNWYESTGIGSLLQPV
jgi:hypothetical protein